MFKFYNHSHLNFSLRGELCMIKSLIFNSLKCIGNRIKLHIKEAIAFFCIFSIVCFVASVDLLPKARAANSYYGFAGAYTIDPVFSKTSPFDFYNVVIPKGDDGNDLPNYISNSSSISNYPIIWRLSYACVLKNFDGSSMLKQNLYKIAEDVASEYNISDKEKLMVYNFRSTEFSGLSNTYGFILATSENYGGSAIFVGCSDRRDNDRRFYFMEDGGMWVSFIDDPSGSIDVSNYAYDFTKTISVVNAKEGLIYNGGVQSLISYSPFYANFSFKLNGNNINGTPSAINAGEYTIHYSLAETETIAGTSGNLKVIINKANQEYKLPEALSGQMSDNVNLITKPPEIIFGNEDANAIKYSMDNISWGNIILTKYHLDYFSPDVDGQYTIYFKIEGNTNFNESTGYVRTNLQKKNQTVEAPVVNLNLQYNGQLQDLITSPPKVLGGEGVSNPTITYSINKKLELNDGGWDIVTPKATDAGDYYVYYKISGDTAYNPYVNYVKVSISKADQEVDPPEEAKLTYNRSYQSLLSNEATVITGNKDEGKKVLYRTNNYEYWHENPVGLNSGTYVVYYRSEGNNNYNEFLGSIEVEIKKANQTVEPPSEITNLKYNGESQKLVSSELKITNGNEDGIRYKINNGNWSSNIPYATEAGEYTIEYKVLGSDNYNEYPGGSITSKISKATQTVDPPTPREDIVYTGYAQQLIKDIPKITKGNTVGLIEYNVVSAQENASWSAENASWNQSLPTTINAGSYVVHYKVAGNNNYEDLMGSITVSILKAEQNVTPPNVAKNIDYDGNEHELFSDSPVVISGNKSVQIQYSIIKKEDEANWNSDNESWSTDTPKASESGTYIIYYKVDGNENYNKFQSSVKSYIRRAQNVTPPDASDDLVYDKTSHKMLSSPATVNSGNNVSIIKYRFDGDDTWYSLEQLPQKTDAGDYVIYYKVDGNDTFAEFIGTIEVTIGKANQEITAPVGKENLVYSNSEQDLLSSKPLIDNGNTNSSIKYRLDETSKWSEFLPTAVNAGTYTVYYMIEENNNYNVFEGNISVTISKAQQEVNAPSIIDDLVYNEQEQPLLSSPPTIVKGNSEDTIEYRLDDDSDWSTEFPSSSVVGEHTVYYRVSENDNYKEFIGSISVTIAKAQQQIFPPQVDDNLTYSDEGQPLLSSPPTVEKGNESGLIEYDAVSEKENDNWKSQNASWISTIPLAKEAGKYFVYYKIQGNENYEDFIGSVPVVVGKLSQEVTPPEITENLSYNARYQQLLSSPASVQKGNSGAKVEYSLNDTDWSLEMPSEMNPGTYTVYYRVEGNNQYNSFEDSIEVNISDPRLSWGKPIEINGITHYVDDEGKTSVEVTDNDIIWLKEESYMAYAWYGLDNSSNVFEKGSRFWVKWINQDESKDEWGEYYDKIDDKNKIFDDNKKLWIFLVGVTAPDGTEYTDNFKAKVPLYVQLGSDWDEEDINSLFIADETDEEVNIVSLSYKGYPEGTARFAKLILRHFSPYALYAETPQKETSSEETENNGNTDESDVETAEYKTYNSSPSISDAETQDDSVMCLSYCVSILSFLGMYKPKFW